MALTITLPKIQAKLNLLTNARINYMDNLGTPNRKAYRDAWLKEANDLAGMVAQYNKELKMEIADDE